VREGALAKKGLDLVVLDVRDRTPVTDFYLLVSGSSTPQLRAITNEIQLVLKSHGVPQCRRSGQAEDGWVVLDCYDVVVHIMLQELREYYAIEELWADAPRLA
jgi:ribosome-associated protein